MIEITNGFTSICTGTDSLVPAFGEMAAAISGRRLERPPTGARVTLDFCRESPLPPGAQVRVRYDFGGDGLREAVGTARPIRAVSRRGQSVVYHYRLSHWITPAAVMQFVGFNVRQRTDEREAAPQDPGLQIRASG